MRKPLESSNIVRLSPGPRPYERRRIVPALGHLTCLALVKHRETEKAVLVSDNDDESSAVWLPKALLIIEPCTSGDFIVATMSRAFADQKGLYPRWIDYSDWSLERIEQLQQATSLAARKRNLHRNYR